MQAYGFQTRLRLCHSHTDLPLPKPFAPEARLEQDVWATTLREYHTRCSLCARASKQTVLCPAV